MDGCKTCSELSPWAAVVGRSTHRLYDGYEMVVEGGSDAESLLIRRALLVRRAHCRACHNGGIR